MDYVESWSRTRRMSTHSISVSSESRSRVSSPGPSSFTENLTIYMNGDKELPDSSKSRESRKPAETHSASSKDINTEKSDLEGLRNELNTSRCKYDELVAENNRLRNDLQRFSSLGFNQLGNENSGKNPHHEDLPLESERLESARMEELKVEINQLKAKLEKSFASANKSESLERELQDVKRLNTELYATIETTQKQADLQLLRIKELESDLEKQEVPIQSSRDQEMASNRRLYEIENELHSNMDAGRDELDGQSLIEELEDDIERTRHELDRVIKDKEHVERQLKFTQSDLTFERTRNAELEEQISLARKSVSRSKADQQINLRDENGPNSCTADQVRHIWSVVERTAQKIDSLGERFVNDKEPSRSQIAAQDPENVPSTPPLTKGQALESGETSMDRAEAYIRKMKAQERALKDDLDAVYLDRDDLRLHLRESEDACRNAKKNAATLHHRIRELEEIKDRMSRVLMYQWGKEEVGEIERNSVDGQREKGMGYRYKYFNKDGTPKNAS